VRWLFLTDEEREWGGGLARAPRGQATAVARHLGVGEEGGGGPVWHSLMGQLEVRRVGPAQHV
jgi:hypothetical protein